MLRLSALFDCLLEVRVEPHGHDLGGRTAEHGPSSPAGHEDVRDVTVFGIVGHRFDVSVGGDRAGSGRACLGPDDLTIQRRMKPGTTMAAKQPPRRGRRGLVEGPAKLIGWRNVGAQSHALSSRPTKNRAHIDGFRRVMGGHADSQIEHRVIISSGPAAKTGPL